MKVPLLHLPNSLQIELQSSIYILETDCLLNLATCKCYQTFVNFSWWNVIQQTKLVSPNKRDMKRSVLITLRNFNEPYTGNKSTGKEYVLFKDRLT